jgi:hypothetical protein
MFLLYAIDEIQMVETGQEILLYGAQEILSHGAFVAAEQNDI